VPSEDEPTREPFLKKWLFGNSERADREQKVLQYIIYRMNEETPLHEVIQDDYVRRNCSQDEIHELVNTPEFVHACRDHLWQTFRSGGLEPGRGHRAASPGADESR
jgi:hypothetical protein